ncbi:uncharacterized protein SAPINGB_P004432 [Magnusiomyces paraingens]|uniref:Uncharacterized protein n=1 Tax=Magnusiomyces paraingens TaxID=2606893 RepID=A0A5E8BZJ7_9ASCO|nr:uncharacterized protein SAPINGB_P004432 [Saprochaete ingens]VVT55110.1 unnamed protein product [Saprochaete ingens]
MAVLSIKSLIGKGKKRANSPSTESSPHSSSQNEESNSSLFSSASSTSSLGTAELDSSTSDESCLEDFQDRSENLLVSGAVHNQHEDTRNTSRRNSIESGAQTLILDDASSTANTLLPFDDSASVTTRVAARGPAGGNHIVNSRERPGYNRTFMGLVGRRNELDESLLYNDDHSKTFPIYATRFKSNAQVFESDLAAKVTRTLIRKGTGSVGLGGSSSSAKTKGKGKGKRNATTKVGSAGANTSSEHIGESSGASQGTECYMDNNDDQSPRDTSDKIPMPPSIYCTPHTSYNPFPKARTLFMTMYTYGSRPQGGGQLLLGKLIAERNLELGLDPGYHAHHSGTGTYGAPGLNSNEKQPLCRVWQEVMKGTIDQVKYVIEFENSLDFAQPTVTMINYGSKRVTDTMYDGIRMRWYGTTGLASTFGSGFFELRFIERANATATGLSLSTAETSGSRQVVSGEIGGGQPASSSNSSSDNSVEDVQRLLQHRQELERQRPPVALYHNIYTKTLSSTRKVGEFTIWEPGYQLADIIVIMGLVLREQEQRKDVEYQHVVSSKFLSIL